MLVVSPQVLKKDLYFDPEFWNLIALRTNCLKLMNEKVVSAALEEIMEDKWISSYCTKVPASRSSALPCQKGNKEALQPAANKRQHKDDANTASKKLKVSPGKKAKAKKVSRTLKDTSSKSLRRSFWQLEALQDNVTVAYGEHRRITRLSEKNPPKRRIRKPRWLMEDSCSLDANNVHPKLKKHSLKHEKHLRSSILKRADGQVKNSINYKPSVNSCLKSNENNNKQQRGYAEDGLKPAPPPQVILELSLPDNELMGTFTEDACNRQRGFPQVLLYKPTLKIPVSSQPVKTVQRKEVVLRARDETMFVLQMHCYARQRKGKGKGLNIQGSVSTITRSSVQGSPPKEPLRELCEKAASEMKARITSQTQVAAGNLEKALQTTRPVSRKTSSAREGSETFVAKMTSAANEVAETPMLDKLLQAQPRTLVGELCEEPAVEMKVTIASQTPTEPMGTQSQDLDVVFEVPDIGSITEVTVSTEVSQSTPEDDNQANMSSMATSDPVPLQPSDVSQKQGHQEIRPGRNTVTSSKASVTQAASTAVDQDSMNDISALTLVTEMVTELPPEELEIDKQQVAENSSSMESSSGSKPKVPQKISRKSSCSIADKEADDEGKRKWQDTVSNASENSEPVETLPESEESKLEYCCTFCNKVFKGCRVVAHAMFHYRKDECMFCGTAFKDDLLAMMHLSDHIEKLKRIKEPVGKQGHENSLSLVSESKDFSTPKTSVKTKTTLVSSSRSSGRLKKLDCSKSVILPDSKPSEFRKLRSNARQADGQVLQQKKQNTLQHLNGETPVHNVNGHIGKKQAVKKNSEAKQPHTRQVTPPGKTSNDRNMLPGKKHGIDVDLTISPAPTEKHSGCSRESKTKEAESRQLPKKASKQSGKEKNMTPQEKVCCPVDGCAWFTDLSKSCVAPLYHALDDHYGEVKPLELAFQVGNGKCSICKRVLWSFDHFLHHVERHRLSPRHPCPHQGCPARFKTGIEMRRHARKHSPLQALCCLPGCSKLFICLWALNLHEREHYASKDSKPDKSTDMQTGDKQNNTQSGKKQQGYMSNDAVSETVSVKDAPRLRQEDTHHLSSGKHDGAASLSAARTSRLKQGLKDRSETKDLNILKNLSNKDASAQPTVSCLRARQTLRKEANTTLTTSKSHRVFSSSLLKQSRKFRHKFRRKLVKVNAKGCKTRRRLAKLNQAVHDENDTDPETIHKDEKGPELTSSLKSAEISKDVSNNSIEEKRKHVAEAEASTDEANLKKSVDKQAEDDVKHKDDLRDTATADAAANILNKTTIKKLHEVRKRPSSDPVILDSSKSKKSKTSTKKTKKNCSPNEPVSVLQDSTKYKSAVEAKAPEAMGKMCEMGEDAQVQNTDSTRDDCDNPAPVIADTVDENMAPPTSSSENTHNLTVEGNSKKTHTTGKEGKKVKNRRMACLGKKNKEGTRREKWPRKVIAKTSAAKKMTTKSEAQEQVEAKTILVNTIYGNVDTSDLTLTKGVNGKTKPAAAAEPRQRNKSKKGPIRRRSDPKKANQRRKKMNRGGVMKAGADQRLCEGKGAASALGGPGEPLAVNGQTANEDFKSPKCEDILAKYSKRPYMRPPPTAYLDEKYITMPKRRKEISFFPWPRNDPAPEQTSASPALQRQRCANCFATFNSAEELQSHLQLQNCSTLFGFDSDDEGEYYCPSSKCCACPPALTFHSSSVKVRRNT